MPCANNQLSPTDNLTGGYGYQLFLTDSHHVILNQPKVDCTRLAEIQQYYENCLNPKLIPSSESLI